MTSRLWYWNQYRSWKAGLRCFAPLCCITNSVQNTDRSRGSIGRSLWRAESFPMFSLYLSAHTGLNSQLRWGMFQLRRLLPGVIDDLVQPLQQGFRGESGDIQHDSGFSARYLVCVVGLLCAQWYHHHGDGVTQALKCPMWAGVSNESSNSRMGLEKISNYLRN